jgi:hypothetical protein
MKERAVERYAGSGVHTGVFLLLWRTGVIRGRRVSK